jgi:hypothetical protein
MGDRCPKCKLCHPCKDMGMLRTIMYTICSLSASMQSIVLLKRMRRSVFDMPMENTVNKHYGSP